MALRRFNVVVMVASIGCIAVMWALWSPSPEVQTRKMEPAWAPRQPAIVDVGVPDILAEPGGEAMTEVDAKVDRELGYHCPSVGDTLATNGTLSDQCTAMLERHYADRQVFDPIVPFKEPLTWRQVFADAAERLPVVLHALREENCRVPQGKIEPDLGEYCASREIVEHALLLGHCYSGRLDSLLQRELRPGGLAEDLGNLTTLRDQSSYWERYQRLEDEHYGAAYSYTMCSQLPDGVVDLAAWELLIPEGSSGDEVLTERYGEAGNAHRASVDLLKEFAARLGNEWALETYIRDEDHIRAMRRITPLLAILHRGRYERWKRDMEYGESQNRMAAEAKDEIEALRNGGGDADRLPAREREINVRLRERQRELEDPHAADIKHIRLTHLYAASAVATGYGIPFDMNDHLYQMDEVTQEDWDAARESAQELFRSDWWKF